MGVILDDTSMELGSLVKYKNFLQCFGLERYIKKKFPSNLYL